MHIHEEHVSEPGMVVIDVTAADEATATLAAAELGRLWRSSGPSAPWQTPGQPGVSVRAYLDLRHRPLASTEEVHPLPRSRRKDRAHGK
ncbi:DUF6207 family protein [Streptomyces noursei]|uniref:DUF6207 family protein n=3 Tax=Streptomyces TaxID=1883 RepID=A0ABY8A2A9_9ACTN|nr:MULTISPECIES: DUF6207 family protein [Streptomyces]ANZ14087.1 hypothetical protein SNOUR_03835 [Streptomyces noursei ATCC 11455]AJC53410.1 hypothetical protein GZL_00806 [Streptomyces sp. 769]MCZ1013262.1 DUF6207 family protein [Streptomyces noursei]WEB38436.1 DUF6207 family protein [Streptomyces yunnanensis]GGX52677.1 hypothetical protein GCM10010341_87570 [Streptomyces noursei]